VKILILIYLLTAIGLTPGGSSTVHIYAQTIHRTTHLIWEEYEPCPVFASYTLALALQLRKKQEKTSVRVDEERQLAQVHRYPLLECAYVFLDILCCWIGTFHLHANRLCT
jgi:hypothetical protein